MDKAPNKGPVGKDDEGELDGMMPEHQERYERDGQKDVIDGPRSLDPFDHRAPDSDHTPNHTTGPKISKPEYGKFSSGRFGL